jgi:hypothetical protein
VTRYDHQNIHSGGAVAAHSLGTVEHVEFLPLKQFSKGVQPEKIHVCHWVAPDVTYTLPNLNRYFGVDDPARLQMTSEPLEQFRGAGDVFEHMARYHHVKAPVNREVAECLPDSFNSGKRLHTIVH